MRQIASPVAFNRVWRFRPMIWIGSACAAKPGPLDLISPAENEPHHHEGGEQPTRRA
jgi:hypothetical protein